MRGWRTVASPRPRRRRRTPASCTGRWCLGPPGLRLLLLVAGHRGPEPGTTPAQMCDHEALVAQQQPPLGVDDESPAEGCERGQVAQAVLDGAQLGDQF